MLAAASTAATIASGSGQKPAAKFVPLKTKNYYPKDHSSLLCSARVQAPTAVA